MQSKRSITGRLKQKNGDGFEILVRSSSNRQGWECIKIPTGSKTFGPNKIIRQKSPFDFVLAKNKIAMFFDAKSIQEGNFTYSCINQTQVTNLINLERQGFRAGYVVSYRQMGVYFYSASYLRKVKPGSSLQRHDGLYLGPADSINFDLILEENILISCPIKKIGNL